MDQPDPLGKAPFFFEDFFRQGLHLVCPKCGAHVVARFGSGFGGLPYWQRRMTLTCGQCGLNRSGADAFGNWLEGVGPRYRTLSAWMRGAVRPSGVRPLPGELRAEFWARTHCHGRELLVANPWHLRSLRGYVAPLVRPDCPYSQAAARDWRVQLPDWMKDDEARAAVLGGIERLERRFADPGRKPPLRRRWLGFVRSGA